MKTKPKVDKEIVIAVIMAITVIEVAALIQGINGTLLTVIVGVLAALGGLAIPMNTIIKKSK